MYRPALVPLAASVVCGWVTEHRLSAPRTSRLCWDRGGRGRGMDGGWGLAWSHVQIKVVPIQIQFPCLKTNRLGQMVTMGTFNSNIIASGT